MTNRPHYHRQNNYQSPIADKLYTPNIQNNTSHHWIKFINLSQILQFTKTELQKEQEFPIK
jgi:hypothetical protein